MVIPIGLHYMSTNTATHHIRVTTHNTGMKMSGSEVLLGNGNVNVQYM